MMWPAFTQKINTKGWYTNIYDRILINYASKGTTITLTGVMDYELGAVEERIET